MKRKLNEADVPEVEGENIPEIREKKPKKEPKEKKAPAPPKPTFANIGLDARLLQAVTSEKFATPTSVQARAIPVALDGKDVLARAKTGSGKTLAYLLPVLNAILRRKAGAKSAKHTSALILVPTKELATQVVATLAKFTAFCAQDIRCENVSRKEDAAVTRARLAESPDVVIATPSRASQWINSNDLKLEELAHLVIDEADLVLNYGYEEDLESIASALPAGVQKIFMSATLRTEVDTLTALFFKGDAQPTILDLSAEEAEEQTTLSQYVLKTAEQDKFLLIYTIFKLQLIKGKVIMFVADIDRCYRVKLFLEQFGIRSCVLNSELPVNSRLHVVEEFNRGVYDIIIAADENEIVGDESSKSKRRKAHKLLKKTKAKEATEEREHADGEPSKNGAEVEAEAHDDDEEEPVQDIEEEEKDDEEEVEGAQPDTPASAPSKRQRPTTRSRSDREYGVSRGIDFRNVACVLNFDLPTSARSYTHRIGRTARAGQTGMALSFFIPADQYRKHKPTSIEQSKHDETVLAAINKEQMANGKEVGEWAFDMSKLEGFRYRLADALRAVTRIAVREARTKELRQELIKSEKLKRHFEENPEELRHLRHDGELSHAARQQPHLKHIPDYLLPAGGKAAVTRDVGFVGIRKEKENRLRKARAFNKGRGKGRIAKGKGLDPLKSLNAKGRGK